MDGNCDFFFQIIIYSQPREEFTIGQQIFQTYNLTWDHDNNQIGFVQQLVIKPDISYTWAVISFWTLIGIVILVAGIAIYCSIFRKIGTHRDLNAEDDEAQEIEMEGQRSRRQSFLDANVKRNS